MSVLLLQEISLKEEKKKHTLFGAMLKMERKPCGLKPLSVRLSATNTLMTCVRLMLKNSTGTVMFDVDLLKISAHPIAELWVQVFNWTRLFGTIPKIWIQANAFPADSHLILVTLLLPSLITILLRSDTRFLVKSKQTAFSLIKPKQRHESDHCIGSCKTNEVAWLQTLKWDLAHKKLPMFVLVNICSVWFSTIRFYECAAIASLLMSYYHSFLSSSPHSKKDLGTNPAGACTIVFPTCVPKTRTRLFNWHRMTPKCHTSFCANTAS